MWEKKYSSHSIDAWNGPEDEPETVRDLEFMSTRWDKPLDIIQAEKDHGRPHRLSYLTIIYSCQEPNPAIEKIEIVDQRFFPTIYSLRVYISQAETFEYLLRSMKLLQSNQLLSNVESWLKNEYFSYSIYIEFTKPSVDFDKVKKAMTAVFTLIDKHQKMTAVFTLIEKFQKLMGYKEEGGEGIKPFQKELENKYKIKLNNNDPNKLLAEFHLLSLNDNIKTEPPSPMSCDISPLHPPQT
jgi:hypothetical protein